MKLATFFVDGRERVGLVEGDGIVDLTRRANVSSIKQVLNDGITEAAHWIGSKPDWSLSDVSLRAPVPDPALIVGIGLNTKSHFEETAELMNRTRGDYPKYPRLFTRSADSHVAHGETILVPSASPHLDYEGEIAVVIGRGGRGISRADALSHIGGYACYNDGSVRDFQKHSNQVTAGKNFVASGSFGPWLLTADEVPDPNALTLVTRINGEVRQRLVMSDLIFDFADLISYISTIFLLRPGDIIVSGSPEGIGALKKQWLKDGDKVEIEIPQVGILANQVKNETMQ